MTLITLCRSLLLFSILPHVAQSALFFTSPTATTVLSGNSIVTQTWVDDGQPPNLSQYGLIRFELCVGNQNQQIALAIAQSDLSLDVSTTSEEKWILNATVGENYDKYFIRGTSEHAPIVFSALFTLDNMTGKFNQTVEAVIAGGSQSSTGTDTSTSPASTNGSVTPTHTTPTDSSPNSTGGSTATTGTTPVDSSATHKSTTTTTTTASTTASTDSPNSPLNATKSSGSAVPIDVIAAIVSIALLIGVSALLLLWRRRKQFFRLRRRKEKSRALNADMEAGSSPMLNEAFETPMEQRPERLPATIHSDLSLQNTPIEVAGDVAYDMVLPGSEKPIRVLSYRRPPAHDAPEIDMPEEDAASMRATTSNNITVIPTPTASLPPNTRRPESLNTTSPTSPASAPEEAFQAREAYLVRQIETLTNLFYRMRGTGPSIPDEDEPPPTYRHERRSIVDETD